MKCFRFHVIKLIRCDRTCQWSITIINKEKSFTPNNSPLSHYSLLIFCLKESSRRNLSEHVKISFMKKWHFFRGWYLNYFNLGKTIANFLEQICRCFLSVIGAYWKHWTWYPSSLKGKKARLFTAELWVVSHTWHLHTVAHNCHGKIKSCGKLAFTHCKIKKNSQQNNKPMAT